NMAVIRKQGPIIDAPTRSSWPLAQPSCLLRPAQNCTHGAASISRWKSCCPGYPWANLACAGGEQIAAHDGRILRIAGTAAEGIFLRHESRVSTQPQISRSSQRRSTSYARQSQSQLPTSVSPDTRDCGNRRRDRSWSTQYFCERDRRRSPAVTVRECKPAPRL